MDSRFTIKRLACAATKMDLKECMLHMPPQYEEDRHQTEIQHNCGSGPKPGHAYLSAKTHLKYCEYKILLTGVKGNK